MAEPKSMGKNAKVEAELQMPPQLQASKMVMGLNKGSKCVGCNILGAIFNVCFSNISLLR